jgi:hypothetical protein
MDIISDIYELINILFHPSNIRVFATGDFINVNKILARHWERKGYPDMANMSFGEGKGMDLEGPFAGAKAVARTVMNLLKSQKFVGVNDCWNICDLIYIMVGEKRDRLLTKRDELIKFRNEVGHLKDEGAVRNILSRPLPGALLTYPSSYPPPFFFSLLDIDPVLFEEPKVGRFASNSPSDAVNSDHCRNISPSTPANDALFSYLSFQQSCFDLYRLSMSSSLNNPLKPFNPKQELEVRCNQDS